MSEKTNVRDIEKERFLAELRIKLEEAADDIKNNRVYNAREVFEELDRKYGYKVWSYIFWTNL